MQPPDGWTRAGEALHREFRFASFADVIAFMVKVSLYCERADHHPDWRNVYNRLVVTLTTHDAGTVTDRDIALAQEMNRAFASFRAAS